MLSFYSNEGITWKYTTAMAPWRGGFYERLVGLAKQGLRKEIGCKLLSWDKLINVTGFVKIDPNHTGNEIHFIAEH